MRFPHAWLLIPGFALAILVAGCPGSQNNNSRTVTDLAGREVAVPETVERVVAFGPGALRLVIYLDGTKRIVGIEDSEKRMVRNIYFRPYAATLDEDFFNLPVIGPGGPGKLPDFEGLLLCKPDILVAVGIDVAQVDNIQSRTGVPVVCLSYGELGVWREEARKSLVLLGEVLGREQRAEEINDYIESLRKDLAKRAQSSGPGEKPIAYFGGISFKGAHGLTSTQAGYPPGEMVNARNPANKLRKAGHLFVDKEKILVWNPDIVFIDIGSKAVIEHNFAGNRDFYGLLNAARNDKVFSLLPYNYYNTNIEIALLNSFFIGKCLYPNAFEDIDMDTKAREIFDTFLGTAAGKPIPAYHVVRFPEQGPVVWEQQNR